MEEAALNFSSDTSAPAHPAILAALADANAGAAPSYGADALTAKAAAMLREVFECDLDIWLVSSGTAANALALSVVCPPTGAILCHGEAHIERDERGAPEFFTGGAKLSLLPGDNARISLDALERRLAANSPDFVHETPAHVLSLSNLTEFGSAYSADQVSALAARARAAGLMVHLDGARFANVVASGRASPAALSWKAGVDAMCLGFTKNGALGCEAVILFGRARELASQLRVRAKRAGLMPPKMRFLAAQAVASLTDGLWLDLAFRANASTRALAEALVAAGATLTQPVDGNEVFARLPEGAAAKLSAAGAGFYPWHDGSHRFVCSWATDASEISALAGVLAGKA